MAGTAGQEGQETWRGWLDPSSPLSWLPGGDRSPKHTPVQLRSSPTALPWYIHLCPHTLPSWAMPCPAMAQAPQSH